MSLSTPVIRESDGGKRPSGSLRFSAMAAPLRLQLPEADLQVGDGVVLQADFLAEEGAAHVFVFGQAGAHNFGQGGMAGDGPALGDRKGRKSNREGAHSGQGRVGQGQPEFAKGEGGDGFGRVASGDDDVHWGVKVGWGCFVV